MDGNGLINTTFVNPHLLRLGNGLAIFANYDSRAISPETFVSDC